MELRSNVVASKGTASVAEAVIASNRAVRRPSAPAPELLPLQKHASHAGSASPDDRDIITVTTIHRGNDAVTKNGRPCKVSETLI